MLPLYLHAHPPKIELWQKRKFWLLRAYQEYILAPAHRLCMVPVKSGIISSTHNTGCTTQLFKRPSAKKAPRKKRLPRYVPTKPNASYTCGQMDASGTCHLFPHSPPTVLSLDQRNEWLHKTKRYRQGKKQK